MSLAPCVAILGPPNSGKTTLLHLVDAALTAHPAEPLAYVVKGNPDRTGRYLHHAPDLREAFKPLVKGRWTRQTPDTIREWVRRARRSLDLVLLDFGGKHDAANHAMLAECSHYIVPDAVLAVARLNLPGGRGVLFNGAASLPVAMALAHAVAHLYQFVACWDPKLSRYVVAISHTPDVRPGDLVE